VEPHEAKALTEYREAEMATLRSLVPLTLPTLTPDERRRARVAEAVNRWYIEHPPEQPAPPRPPQQWTALDAGGTLTLEQWRRAREQR
jgi:hypothetical protein